MLKNLMRRLVFPSLLMCALFVVISICAEFGVTYLLGGFEVGRISPYYNVHHSEELAQGLYSPFTDAIFVSYVLVNGMCTFGVSSLYASIGARREQLVIAAIPFITALLYLIFRHRDLLFTSDTHDAMFAAVLFELLTCFFSASIGIFLGYRMHRHGVVSDGHEGIVTS